MTAWQFGGVTLYQGNCMDVLPTLPAESVQACITSPPYWGLRDYGTARWEGGDSGCDHVGSDRWYTENTAAKSSSEAFSQPGEANIQRLKDGRWRESGVCVKCGARHVDDQLGLERVPDCLGWATKQPCGECYVCHTVAWAREVRRVLRDDGVLFLVLGDSYAGSWGNYHPNSPPGKHGQRLKQTARWNRPAYESQEFLPPTATVDGLKPKDLVGIPWRVALALQADGWWLRSDVIWAKPNPMPESVTDRPTKSHEYVFILAKSQRYYWDAEAVKEKNTSGPSDIKKMLEGKDRIWAKHLEDDPGPLNAANPRTNIGNKRAVGNGNGRNLRTVWNIATQPYAGAHFAVFPEKLVEPMVKAATSERGCCPKCGKAWERVTQREVLPPPDRVNNNPFKHGAMTTNGEGATTLRNIVVNNTAGWSPACACDAGDPIPCTILDPFGGSGTVASIALRLGRRAILCELNPDYIELQKERIEQTQPALEGLLA